MCLGDWTGQHCEVHKLKCWPGETKGPCGKHGECRYDQAEDLHYCACHLWWKGVYFIVTYSLCAWWLLKLKPNSGKYCDTRMSIEEIERQRVPLAERMVREPFWLGLITVLVVMIVIGVGYLVKKHLPEKIEKLLRTDLEATMATGNLEQNNSGDLESIVLFIIGP